MTVYQSMGRGSWIVQRRLLGLRIRHATGFYTRSEAEQFEELLLRLAAPRLPRRDLLAAFAGGRLTGPELAAGIERFGLETYQVQVGNTSKARGALYRWLNRAKLAAKTANDYRFNLGRLVGKLPKLHTRLTDAEEAQLVRGPGVDELPKLLRRAARTLTADMFVQVKATIQSFFRDTEDRGQESELYRAVRAIKGDRRDGRDVQGGLSPDRAREVAIWLAQQYAPAEAQMWWGLCISGMGPREYWRYRNEPLTGRWDVLEDRLLVHGTKRQDRDRTVLRLGTPIRPVVGVRAFRKHLRKAGDALGIRELTPYVARRTFAHFLELAGVLDSRCDAYMGHSPKTDRAKYREHDVTPYLKSDRDAVLAKIGPEPTYMAVVA